MITFTFYVESSKIFWEGGLLKRKGKVLKRKGKVQRAIRVKGPKGQRVKGLKG